MLDIGNDAPRSEAVPAPWGHPSAPDVAGERQSYRAAKRALDILAAGIALLILLPVFVVLWGAVRIDGGPAFFGHRRIGLDKKPFFCLKFRSMRPDAEAALQSLLAADPEAAREWSETRKLTRDPRVTLVGRFLRSTSLDEIPQLVNVLRGDMSLVGPRPVVQEELDRYYGPYAAAYASVRPGITGLWQVSGRSSTSYETRVELDASYVAKLSFANDTRILLRTIPEVLKRTGAC